MENYKHSNQVLKRPSKAKFFWLGLKGETILIILILTLEIYDHIIDLTLKKGNGETNLLSYIFFIVMAINLSILLVPMKKIMKFVPIKSIFKSYRMLIKSIIITVSVYESRLWNIIRFEETPSTKSHLFVIALIMIFQISSHFQKLVWLIICVFYLNFRFLTTKIDFFVSLSDFIFMFILGFMGIWKSDEIFLTKFTKDQQMTSGSKIHDSDLLPSIAFEKDELFLYNTTPLNISILLRSLKENSTPYIILKNLKEIFYKNKIFSQIFRNKLDDLNKLVYFQENFKFSWCDFQKNDDLNEKFKDSVYEKSEFSFPELNQKFLISFSCAYIEEKTIKRPQILKECENTIFIEINMNDSLFNLLDEFNLLILNENEYERRISLMKCLNELFQKIQKKLIYKHIETNLCYTLQILFLLEEGEIYFSIQLIPHLIESENIDFKAKIKCFQSKFLKSISHELKTPMNGAITLLTSSEPNLEQDAWESFISPALNSLYIMNSSINDIIDYSSFFQKNFEISKTKVNLKAIVQSCFDLFSIQSHTRDNLDFRLIIGDNIPHLIQNDGERIKQILINLLTNSFKFTQNGEIIITMGKVEDDENYFISVHDSGIGLSEKKKTKIFTLCESINGDLVGLGLRISNKIAKRLNFENTGLNCESNSNLTKFTFFISHFGSKSIEGIIDDEESYCQDLFRSKLRMNNRPKFLNFRKNQCMINIEIINNRNIEENNAILLNESHRMNLIDFNSHNEPTIQLNSLFYNTGITKNTSIPKTTSKDFNFSTSIVNKCDGMREEEKEDYASSLFAMYESIKSKSCACPDTLIVDDNDFNIYALKLCLNKYNLKIEKAVNGLEALNLVKKFSLNSCCSVYKIIFMDFDMPVMNGHDSARNIKFYLNSIDKDSKIIGCSAFSSEKDILKCFESGMDDYESKPLNNEKVERILAKWFPQ